MTKTRFDVVGLGASTVDVLTLVERFPAGREFQQGVATIIQGGGPVATAMVAVARLGRTAAMIDSIGDDWAGQLVLEDFRRAGVETGMIEIHSGQTTAVSNILVSAEDGARAIMFVPGSAPQPSLSSSQMDLIRFARILHISGRYWQACMQAVELARAHEVLISLDGGAGSFSSERSSLVALADICIVAREFAERYTGEAELSRAAQQLVRAGPRIAVVTDGRNGSWICTREGLSFHQPAFLFPRTLDTTGCGDSYHGAFLAAICQGLAVEQAAAVASAVAGLNSQQLGGRAGIAGWKQVVEFLAPYGIRLEGKLANS